MVLAATTVAELGMNLRSMRMIIPNLKSQKVTKRDEINTKQAKEDEFLVAGVRRILGSWVDYTFPSPEVGVDGDV